MNCGIAETTFMLGSMSDIKIKEENSLRWCRLARYRVAAISRVHSLNPTPPPARLARGRIIVCIRDTPRVPGAAYARNSVCLGTCVDQ